MHRPAVTADHLVGKGEGGHQFGDGVGGAGEDRKMTQLPEEELRLVIITGVHGVALRTG